MENVLPEDFDSKIKGDGQKIMILFYADWCPYCTNFKPIFEGMNSHKIQKKVALLNEDENPLWDKFNIQVVPTIIAFQNGKIIARRDAKKNVGLTGQDIESLTKELS